MATISTLAAVRTFPSTLRITGVGTTWQEISLPTSVHADTVSIYLSAAGKIVFAGDAGSPTDGGAVGTTYQPVAATTWLSWKLGPGPGARAGSFFVAADTGTVDVVVSIEGR